MVATTLPTLSAALLLGAALAGCASHEDDVCQSVGDCAQGGSSDWVASCQAEAKALRQEADSSGCGGVFDDYYACADSSFACQGATPTFPGCDAKLGALDACFGEATAGTSCQLLATRESACTAAPASTGPPPACTLARDCGAQCFLAQVSDVCAPRVDELATVAACTAACPP
jgi:hypothetical protein